MARLILTINNYIIRDADGNESPISATDQLRVYRSENNGATWSEFCAGSCDGHEGFAHPDPEFFAENNEWSQRQLSIGLEGDGYNDGIEGFKLFDLIRIELYPTTVEYVTSPEDYFTQWSNFSAITDSGLFQIRNDVTSVGIFGNDSEPVIFEERVVGIITPPPPDPPVIQNIPIGTQIFDMVTYENEPQFIITVEATDNNANDNITFTAVTDNVNLKIDVQNHDIVQNRFADIILSPEIGSFRY
jgi:hypothetical protein